MKITSIHYAGNAWRSTMKGTDRICEDLILGDVRKHEDKITGRFILADGASLVKGREAIRIVKEVFSAKPWDNPKPDALKPGITDTVSAMHRYALASNAETTLVFCVVLPIPDQPILSVIRFGNSNCILTHESENTPRRMLFDGTYQRPLPPIGAPTLQKIDTETVDKHLTTAYLSRSGLFRIVAFSDGVLDGRDKAVELIFQYNSLDELVEKAALWPQTTHYVGHDDWSVGGLEIKVEE